MKRYLFLLTAFLLAGVLQMSGKTLYFETNDINATYMGISGEYNMTPVKWEADGTATATLDDKQGMNICLNSGYQGVSISVNDEVVASQFSGNVFLPADQLPDGALVKVTTAKAEAINVIVKGNPSQIAVNYAYHTYDAWEWQGGELTIPITTKQLNVTITARTGYGFKSIKLNGAEQLSEDFKTFTISTIALRGGDYVYDVESMSLTELRSSTFNVDVVGSTSDVTVTLNGDRSNVITGEALRQPIHFSPEFDLPIYVQNARTGHTFYKVEVDGMAVAADGEIYKIYELADGATVKVEVDFPDVQIPIRLSFVNYETESSIKYVLGMNSNIIPPAEWQAEGWSVAMGTPLSIAFNTDDYNVSALLNGVETPEGYVSFVALDEAGYDLVITANPRNPFVVTFYYEGLPSHFKVQIGATGDDYVEMTGADTTKVNVPRNRNRVRIVPDEDWVIAAVYADGNVAGADIPVTGNMTIDVFMEEYLRTLPLAVYLDPATDWNGRTLTLAQENAFRHKVLDLEPGYNVVNFNEGDLPLELGVTINGSHDYPGFLNGEQLATPIGWFEEMTPGSVIMLYGEYPEFYNVDFSIDERVAAVILRDHITRLENPGEQTVLQGTRFTIVPDNPEEVIVKVNGVTLDEVDGKYVLTADSDLHITLEPGNPSGVEGVGSESLSDVFSLQGIRVLKNATPSQLRQLPAGIYIISGKKVAVK